jgi:hypothetical protein
MRRGYNVTIRKFGSGLANNLAYIARAPLGFNGTNWLEDQDGLFLDIPEGGRIEISAE